MSFIARSHSPVRAFWVAFSGGSGPFWGAASFLCAVWLLILCIPASVWLLFGLTDLGLFRHNLSYPSIAFAVWLLLVALGAIGLPWLGGQQSLLKLGSTFIASITLLAGFSVFWTIVSHRSIGIVSAVSKVSFALLAISVVPLLLYSLLWSVRLACWAVVCAVRERSFVVGLAGVSKGVIGSATALSHRLFCGVVSRR